MRDNYLIHGTNALKGALRYISSDDFRYEPRSVSIYLSAACKALTYLVEDEESLKMIANGMRGVPNQRYSEFEDLFEEFVKPDHALLVAAGMDEKMANYFFRDAEAMHQAMRSKRDINSDLLREKLKELQYSVCSSGLETLRNGKSPLWRSVQIIGGGAIITTNFAADSIIGGLASAFSQAYGGHIVGKGLDERSER